MKTLIVVAHMDDETFGLGGTLSKMCNENPQEVCVVVMCDGREGINKTERRSAFYENIRKLGCSCRVYNFDDLTLERHQLSHIADMIRWEVDVFKPERVICNSIDDIHQDHEIVSKATRIACRPYNSSIRSLLEFKIPSSSPAESLFNISVDISDVLKEKTDMCYEYKSELSMNPNHPNSISGILATNKSDGVQFGVESAELMRLVWTKY